MPNTKKNHLYVENATLRQQTVHHILLQQNIIQPNVHYTILLKSLLSKKTPTTIVPQKSRLINAGGNTIPLSFYTVE